MNLFALFPEAKARDLRWMNEYRKIVDFKENKTGTYLVQAHKLDDGRYQSEKRIFSSKSKVTKKGELYELYTASPKLVKFFSFFGLPDNEKTWEQLDPRWGWLSNVMDKFRIDNANDDEKALWIAFNQYFKFEEEQDYQGSVWDLFEFMNFLMENDEWMLRNSVSRPIRCHPWKKMTDLPATTFFLGYVYDDKEPYTSAFSVGSKIHETKTDSGINQAIANLKKAPDVLAFCIEDVNGGNLYYISRSALQERPEHQIISRALQKEEYCIVLCGDISNRIYGYFPDLSEKQLKHIKEYPKLTNMLLNKTGKKVKMEGRGWRFHGFGTIPSLCEFFIKDESKSWENLPEFFWKSLPDLKRQYSNNRQKSWELFNKKSGEPDKTWPRLGDAIDLLDFMEWLFKNDPWLSENQLLRPIEYHERRLLPSSDQLHVVGVIRGGKVGSPIRLWKSAQPTKRLELLRKAGTQLLYQEEGGFYGIGRYFVPLGKSWQEYAEIGVQRTAEWAQSKLGLNKSGAPAATFSHYIVVDQKPPPPELRGQLVVPATMVTDDDENIPVVTLLRLRF